MNTLDRTTVLDMIGIGRGPRDSLIIPIQFIDWLGGYAPAVLLNQILYWRDVVRREGREEFYKSYEQWRCELRLSERDFREALARVREVGVVTTPRRDPNGNRVLFYRIDEDAFLEALQAFLYGPARTPCTGRDDQGVRAGADTLYEPFNTENTTENTDREPPDPPYRPDSGPISTKRGTKTQDAPTDPDPDWNKMKGPRRGQRIHPAPLGAVPMDGAFAEMFAAFWAVYPARNGARAGRRDAEKALSLIPAAAWPAVLTATRQYAGVCSGPDPRTPKDAAHFLADDFWRDFLAVAPPSAHNGHAPSAAPGLPLLDDAYWQAQEHIYEHRPGAARASASA